MISITAVIASIRVFLSWAVRDSSSSPSGIIYTGADLLLIIIIIISFAHHVPIPCMLCSDDRGWSVGIRSRRRGCLPSYLECPSKRVYFEYYSFSYFRRMMPTYIPMIHEYSYLSYH